MKTSRYSLVALLLLGLLSACDNEKASSEQPETSLQQGTPLTSEQKAEPLITADEAARMAPAIQPWLEFHGLDISRFRRESQSVVDLYAADDAAGYYYEAFDPDTHEQYLPVIRDYSPNKRRYINLLEHQEDGIWYFKGADDNQQIRLVDLDAGRSMMFLFTGTMFVDAAFWTSDDEFLLVQYNDFDDDYLIRRYDLAGKTLTLYRYHADTPPQSHYLEQNMKNRGIIID